MACRVPVPGAGFRAPGRIERAGTRSRFGRGMPLRDRQPQHVGERAREPVGDGTRQPRDLGGKHWLRRHDPFQIGEPSLMVAGAHPVQHETIGQLPGEPHPNPHTRTGLRREPFWHQVVEGPVQVGERNVHRDPGDRVVRGRDQPFRAFRLPARLGSAGGLRRSRVRLRRPRPFVLRIRHRPVLPDALPSHELSGALSMLPAGRHGGTSQILDTPADLGPIPTGQIG